MPGLYAAFLLLSICGLGILDYRYKLAIFYKTRQSLIILAASQIVFIVWDTAGILANIFRIGQNEFLLGINIGEFPAEELLFLVILNYTSLVIYTSLRKVKG